MKTVKFFMLFATIITFSACSPKISTNLNSNYPTLNYQQKVHVIGLNQAVPYNAELLGKVKVSNGGAAHSEFDVVLNKAILAARKQGGNVIQITSHVPTSNFGGIRHVLKANILRVADSIASVYAAEKPADSNYAVLNVYRFRGSGQLVSYNLYLGDSILCRVYNNYSKTILLDKEQLSTLWARTESKSEVPVDIKLGNTYYLRCSVVFGIAVGRPRLELVTSSSGKFEFESFKSNKK